MRIIEVKSNHVMHCTESNDKKNRRICVNSNLMIGDKKLIIIMYRGLHYEPTVDLSMLSFDLKWPENLSYNIHKHEKHPKVCPTYENRSLAETNFIQCSLCLSWTPSIITHVP